MAIKIGKPHIELNQLLDKTTEFNILHHYFGITEVPCIINSPIRADKKPSFGFYSLDGHKIHWTDLSTRDSGGTIDLLMKYWGVSYSVALSKIWEDLPNIKNLISSHNKLGKPQLMTTQEHNKNSDLKCKIRDWKQWDIDYWGSYGITLKWLKYADVYPISHKIVITNGIKRVFPTDKLAYVYVEHKEGNTTLKIYQPHNKGGFKWANKHDRSVISLWTKIPEYGDKVCICASLKDALCLWGNTGIPSVAIQGEGYTISDTAINSLKKRFKQVYILFDNDETGIFDSQKLGVQTGFKIITLPPFKEGKDISDLFKSLGDKNQFNKIMLPLFKA